MKKCPFELGVLANTHEPSAWEVEAEGSGVHGHPQLHCEFEANLGFTGYGGTGCNPSTKEVEVSA